MTQTETKTLADIIISTTGYSNGWGSAPYKTVHGLTPEERQHAREGGIVLITDCPMAGGNHGTTIRQVKFHGGRYYHRVPSEQTLSAAGL